MLKKTEMLLKTVIFVGFSIFTLAGCAGKESLVLEQTDADKWQEDIELPSEKTDISYEDETEELKQSADAVQDTGQSAIYVHICGAVLNPGVYELAPGSRVFEGIEAAGGFCEDACEYYVNQAECLIDGQRLVIPTTEEIETAMEEGGCQELWQVSASEPGVESAEASSGGGGLVNINTATESELGSISGIGAGKAAAIVKYRQENGSFASVEDIMKVSGIKEGTYEKIKDKITVK